MSRKTKHLPGLYNVYDMDADPTRCLACYQARNPQEAINRFISDQAATASTFRKGQPMSKFGRLEARRMHKDM